jgi:hypothetical protein
VKWDDEIDEAGNKGTEASKVGAQIQLSEAVFPVERGPQVTFDLLKKNTKLSFAKVAR